MKEKKNICIANDLQRCHVSQNEDLVHYETECLISQSESPIFGHHPIFTTSFIFALKKGLLVWSLQRKSMPQKQKLAFTFKATGKVQAI